MRILRIAGAYVAAAATTYVAAAAFYTQQIIAKQAAIGMVYTPGQQAGTYLANFTGLWLYGSMLAVGLLIGFAVAAGVKRVLKPLAPIAYPAAGAAAVLTVIMLIEAQRGGGAGVIGGARDAPGMALQALAGALGGLVFALAKGRGAA
jgi:hypothetical protein